jgi:hypothetical protein
MMILTVQSFIFPAAFALLPGVMDTPEARAMLLAIGLQESKFEARRQLGGGPARGLWQFERGGGTVGVLTHASSKPYARLVCAELLYKAELEPVFDALPDNDVLACCFARLLLWTLPGLLPSKGQTERGWAQYSEAWRPGKPHPEDWPGNFAQAWGLVAP